MWDVFISHASEDKATVARPLRDLLVAAGLTVWLDEAELKLGDSLRSKIDEGLAQSRYGVVILSPAFFAKDWPQRELNGLAARESLQLKVLLPIWHGVDRDFITSKSPILADKLAVKTEKGLDYVAMQVREAISASTMLPVPVLVESPVQPIVSDREASQNNPTWTRRRIVASAGGAGLLIVGAAEYLVRRSSPTKGHAVLMDGYTDYQRSGFCFSSGLVVAWNSEDADILVSNQPHRERTAEIFIPYSAPPFDGSARDKKALGGIAQLPNSHLDTVKEAPGSGYQWHFFAPVLNAVYCVRTRDGAHFAKIQVSDLSAEKIEFDWVFQPNGSRRFG